MQARIIRKFNFWEMLRRKKYHFLVPFIFLMVGFIALAFSLPIYYKSSMTILVEESDIPEGIVEDNFTGFIDQRLDTITQRIMSRTRLLNLIKRHNLYADLKENHSNEELVSIIRERIKLETISSDAVQGGLNMPLRGTISFTLSFEDQDYRIAQKITSELGALYIQENQANLEKKLDVTVSFLNSEQNLLEKKLSALETEIANFKTTHMEEMPDQVENNIQRVADLEQEIEQLNIDLQSLLQNKIETNGQLMNTNMYSQIIDATGQRVMDPEDKLDTLRFEYLKKRATYSPKHPDLIALKMEIEALEKVVGRRSRLADMRKHLTNLEAEYIKNAGRLGEKHPTLTTLRTEIEVTRKELRALEKQMGQKQEMMVREPDNPAYITLQANLRTINLDIDTANKKRKNLLYTLSKYKKHIDNSPKVEKAYLNLTREYEHLKEVNSQLLTRTSDAKEAQEVDKLEKGQKFSVIDAASLPEKPSKPNVPIIFMLGLIISLSFSIGVLYLSEHMDSSIRTATELSAATGQHVLISVPYIYDSEDKDKKNHRLIFQLVIILLLLIGAVWASHHYYVTYHLPRIT